MALMAIAALANAQDRMVKGSVVSDLGTVVSHVQVLSLIHISEPTRPY